MTMYCLDYRTGEITVIDTVPTTQGEYLIFDGGSLLDKAPKRAISIYRLANLCNDKIEIRPMGSYGEGAFATKEITRGEWLIYGGWYTDTKPEEDAQYSVTIEEICEEICTVYSEYALPLASKLQHLPEQHSDPRVATENFASLVYHYRIHLPDTNEDKLLPILVLQAKRVIAPGEILGWDYADQKYWQKLQFFPALFEKNGIVYQQDACIPLLSDKGSSYCTLNGSTFEALLSEDTQDAMPGIYISNGVPSELYYFGPAIRRELSQWYALFNNPETREQSGTFCHFSLLDRFVYAFSCSHKIDIVKNQNGISGIAFQTPVYEPAVVAQETLPHIPYEYGGKYEEGHYYFIPLTALDNLSFSPEDFDAFYRATGITVTVCQSIPPYKKPTSSGLENRACFFGTNRDREERKTIGLKRPLSPALN